MIHNSLVKGMRVYIKKRGENDVVATVDKVMSISYQVGSHRIYKNTRDEVFLLTDDVFEDYKNICNKMTVLREKYLKLDNSRTALIDSLEKVVIEI